MSERLKQAISKPGKEEKPYKPGVLVEMVNFTVGWCFGDRKVWNRLRQLFYIRQKGLHNGKPMYLSVPIPYPPPGQGTHWLKIFRHIAGKFKKDIPDKWMSYSLSYMALRDCALNNKQNNYSYVYQSCLNRHLYFIKKERKFRSRHPQKPKPAMVDPWPATDLGLDFESALKRLGKVNATICRSHLVEGLDFKQIGREVGLDTSTVCRRFHDCLPKIKLVMEDYK